jgi:hypothetical protein
MWTRFTYTYRIEFEVIYKLKRSAFYVKHGISLKQRKEKGKKRKGTKRNQYRYLKILILKRMHTVHVG